MGDLVKELISKTSEDRRIFLNETGIFNNLNHRHSNNLLFLVDVLLDECLKRKAYYQGYQEEYSYYLPCLIRIFRKLVEEEYKLSEINDFIIIDIDNLIEYYDKNFQTILYGMRYLEDVDKEAEANLIISNTYANKIRRIFRCM
jgi:hypothetical protein